MRVVNEILNSSSSIQKIAERSGISIETIENIISGTIPSIKEFKILAKVLKVPFDYLVSSQDERKELNLLFRKSESRKYDYYIDKFSYLVGNSTELLKDDYVLNNSISKFKYFPNNTYGSAESLAKKFRIEFLNSDFYSPLLDLPELIDKKLNFILYIKEFGTNVDGASVIFNGVPYIFISPRFEARMLFTIAHELGHILAHHEFEENYFNVDENISFRNNTEEEYFCNSFASCLLLPSLGVTSALRRIRSLFGISGSLGDIEILYLSRIFGVSFEVVGRRCEDLDLLPKGGAASLYEVLKKQHGSPEKRADELDIPSRVKIQFPDVPHVLVTMAIEKINNGDLSIGRASEWIFRSILTPVPGILTPL